MRKGDDFERITTSLKKQDGQRAVGTLLSRDHPAYALMLQGQPYTGRAVLFGKPYMTHYEAVRDAAGTVVAILFIGFDITDFQTSLLNMVAGARFFASGGTYVIDPRQSNADAVFVSHPTAAGKKVMEVFPQADSLLTQLRSAPAGALATPTPLFAAGITDGNWAPVSAYDMSSKVDPNITVLGDAAAQGAMPKSGFSANSQAKVAANAIVAPLTGSRAFPARYSNTCWSLLDTDDGIKVGATYEASDTGIVSIDSFVSQVGETADVRAATYRESLDWYRAITSDMFV